MSKVLFLSQKTVGKNMSGLGIRVWELARVLAAKHSVTIGKGSFRQIFSSDVVIVQAFFLGFHWLLLARLLGKRIVVDAYSPFQLEHLETFRKNPLKLNLMRIIDALRIKFLFKIGDFFLCASERQKELWRNPAIAVVPTGVREEAPVQRKRVLKGVIPGIAVDDRVVLWSSGIWPWLDPLSAVRAVNLIPDEKVKLVFFGLKVIDSVLIGEQQPLLKEAVELAGRLGLNNRRVFFVYDRLPYDEIADYLLDADIALNLQHDHPETRYAFRGRMLDYIWAGLPVVATRGDVLSDEIAKWQAGVVVDYENEKEIAAAIKRLLTDREFYERCRNNLRKLAETLCWGRVAQPLVEFVERC